MDVLASEKNYWKDLPEGLAPLLLLKISDIQSATAQSHRVTPKGREVAQ